MHHDHLNDDQGTRVAGASPQAGQQLGRLDDYEIADGYSDIRGWPVQTADGRVIGSVHELLVDLASLEVTYLEVTPAEHVTVAKGYNFSHVPIDGVELDTDAKAVIIPWLAARQSSSAAAASAAPRTVTSSPAPAPAPVRPVVREAAPRVQSPPPTHAAARDDVRDDSMRVQRAEEELVVGTRRVNTGRIGVRKRVATEHVSQPVTTRRDEVSMERRPVAADQARALQPSITEGEIRIPVIEEEIVVEKRPVVREEIVIRTNQVTETQRIEADVRKERVDIDRQDAATRRALDPTEDDRGRR